MASSSAGWQPIPARRRIRRNGGDLGAQRTAAANAGARASQPRRNPPARPSPQGLEEPGTRRRPRPAYVTDGRLPRLAARLDSFQLPARYEAEGNVRHAVLPDGSEVELDLNTQLSFANFKDIRRVSLDRGEAYFHVTHDSAHPFVVKAGNGSITVTGTRFNVWTYQDNVVVTVTEGSVKVRSEGSGNDSSLTPGMQASYYPGLLQPLVEAVDTRQTLAWREGRLVLDDLPLSKALPLINRYLDAPLVLGDRSAAKLRIGGIYSTRDIRSLVDALPKVLPVDLEHREDGSIRISSRYAQL